MNRSTGCYGAMAKPQPDERPYHHGDLRRAIVKAALEILSETQSLDFSLRELARRAGVSHNAPYKHFADKRELLAAVSAAGFDALTKRMADEIAGLGSPRAAVVRDAARLHSIKASRTRRSTDLMFGGYLSGPDHERPVIELRREAEKTKALACRPHHCGRARDVQFRIHLETNAKLLVPFWRAGPSCTG